MKENIFFYIIMAEPTFLSEQKTKSVGPAVCLSPNWVFCCPGGHAAESGQGDDDCHQWSGGVWQAKIKT